MENIQKLILIAQTLTYMISFYYPIAIKKNFLENLRSYFLL